jgi:hypothetical protein
VLLVFRLLGFEHELGGCTWVWVYLGMGVPGYGCTWVWVYLGMGVPGYIDGVDATGKNAVGAGDEDAINACRLSLNRSW